MQPSAANLAILSQLVQHKQSLQTVLCKLLIYHSCCSFFNHILIQILYVLLDPKFQSWSHITHPCSKYRKAKYKTSWKGYNSLIFFFSPETHGIFRKKNFKFFFGKRFIVHMFIQTQIYEMQEKATFILVSKSGNKLKNIQLKVWPVIIYGVPFKENVYLTIKFSLFFWFPIESSFLTL